MLAGAVVDSMAATGELSASAMSLIGQTIDGFRVESILGGGAFGTVYRGRQLGLDRPVAIKVPTHEIAIDPVMARRFAREARSAARITHPGVVAIYAVGELADGRPYLAMQLIDGEPLDRILAEWADSRSCARSGSRASSRARCPRPTRPRSSIAISSRRTSCGDAIATATIGSRSSTSGSPSRKPGNADATRLTAGGVIGTPHYMSPEQAHGEQVDARADLYALGCILFELVTGQPPFDGSGFEVLLAHLGRPLPTPSERNPDVPEVVDELVMHAHGRRSPTTGRSPPTRSSR